MSPERVTTSSRLRRGTAGLEFRTPHAPRRSGRRRLRVRLILQLLILALVIVLLGEVIYALYHSPRFALTAITIEGAGPASESLIREKLPASGGNLFAFPEQRFRRELGRDARFSFLAQVKLTRRLPGTLKIKVEERRPVAYLEQSWGRVYLDSRGRIFQTPDPPPAGLPELRGVVLPEDAPGGGFTGAKAEALQKGLAALTKSPKLKVQLLTVDDRDWLTARLQSGLELRFGAPEQLEEKVQRAEVALSQPGQPRSAEYYDFSAPEAPVWKPKGP
jgi:cell division protein FtsQ